MTVNKTHHNHWDASLGNSPTHASQKSNEIQKWQTILNVSLLMMTMATTTCKTVGSLHIHFYVYAHWREDDWQSWPPPSFPDIGASKSPPLKLDWEELNWANLCLPSNSQSNFLRWEALIDKEILPSTLHRSHSSCDPERGIQPWLRGTACLFWALESAMKIYIRGGKWI